MGFLTAHLTQEPPAPSSVATGIPPSWDDLVLTLLHKDPAQRYPNAADLAQALRQLDRALEPALPAGQPTLPATMPETMTAFRMSVDDVFSITGRGTVVVGRIECGVIKVNEEVELVGTKEKPIKATVTGVEMSRKRVDAGQAGDKVGLLLRGVERKHVERGMVVMKPGVTTTSSVAELLRDPDRRPQSARQVQERLEQLRAAQPTLTSGSAHPVEVSSTTPATATQPDPAPPPQVPASPVEAAANPAASAAASAPPGARRWRPSRRALLLAGVGAAGIAAVPVGIELHFGKQPPKPQVISSSAARILHADLGGAVASVAFSPDGKTLASATGNGRIWLWSVATRRPVATLTLIPDTHGSVPDTTAVAFSPNGKILAGNVDLFGSKNTWLWDVATRKVMTTFTSNNVGGQTLAAVAFSPDSKTLASGNTSDSGNRMLSLWDVATHRRIADIGAVASSVAFSPDGTTMAVGTDSGNVELVDLTTQNGTESLDAGDSVWVRSVAFSPDGSTLACGVIDAEADSPGAVQLWNMAARTKTASLGTNQCETVAFSPNGRLIASCSTKSGLVQLWNPTTRTNTTTLDTSTAQVASVAFSPDGQLLASGGTRVMLWKMDTQ